MQGCLDSWPVYHHHRPKRLFALHLTRLPARGKGTRLLAATGADVLCACSCEWLAMLPVTGSRACTPAHVAYKAGALTDFPAHHALAHQRVGNRVRLRIEGLQASELQGWRSQLGALAGNQFLPPFARRCTSALISHPAPKPSLAPTTHAQSWRLVTCSVNAPPRCKARFHPLTIGYRARWRANEARGDSASLSDSQRDTGDNIVHARCAWRLNGRRKRKRGTKGEKVGCGSRSRRSRAKMRMKEGGSKGVGTFQSAS